MYRSHGESWALGPIHEPTYQRWFPRETSHCAEKEPETRWCETFNLTDLIKRTRLPKSLPPLLNLHVKDTKSRKLESKVSQKWQQLQVHLLRDGSPPVSRTRAAGRLSKLWHLLK